MEMTKMNPKLLILPVVALIFCFSSRALADDVKPESHDSGPKSTITLGAVAGLTGARTDTSTPQQTGVNDDRKWGAGASVMFDTPIADAFSLGIGAIYQKRTFDIGNSTLEIERSVPTLFIPVEAKLWFGNFFDIGAGGFGSIRLGDEQNKIIAGSATTFSYSSGQRETLEFGMTLSAAVTFPFTERTGITVEGRYLRGFTDSSEDSAYNEKIDDFMLTAGLRISL